MAYDLKQSRFDTYGCGCLIIFWWFITVFSVFSLITLVVKNQDTRQLYSIIYNGISENYPINTQIQYIIDFNISIMQANFVYYIASKYRNEPCDFAADPYKINKLQARDYANTGYDIGQLVPTLCAISGAVPMISDFINGPWAVSNMRIRLSYAGKLIYKGCKYDENFIWINRTNNNFSQLFIPDGCFYVVFDTNNIFGLPAPILDYGFICRFCANPVSILPPWVIAI